MNRYLIFSLACLLCGFVGCRGYHTPFQPPGTIQQQRLNASVHDPYVDNEAGPEVVGGRPRDYQKPWSEADRSRAWRSGAWGRQPVQVVEPAPQ
jgi:hypothetical protein